MNDNFKAANLLQLVIDNKISPIDAREKWPMNSDNKILKQAFHMLYHYEDDEDIREKDSKYAKWQVSEFQKIIDQLRKA